MLKYSSLLAAGLFAGGAIVAFAPSASANCAACSKPTTSTYYRTVHPASTITRYRDVSTYRRVPRIHTIVQVTRVQPVVHIHEVTRVHHHTIFYTRNAYASVTQHVAPIQYVTHSIVNTYDCGCGL